MSSIKQILFFCHVYNRGHAEPCVGTFFAQTRDECMALAHEAVIAYKQPFSDKQYMDALDCWCSGGKFFELDEDEFSLAFGHIDINVKTCVEVTL